MKIIHTSDWHLGAYLLDHERLSEQKAFLDWVLDLLRRERPDALLVSGDVYDSHTPSSAATEVLFRFLADVKAANLPTRIVLTAGNHDSPSVLRATSSVLGHVGTMVVADSPLVADVSSLVVPIPGPDGHPGLVVGAIPFLSSGQCANACPDASLERPERVRGGFAAYVEAVLEACRVRAAGAPIVLMGHCAIGGARFTESEEGRRDPIAGLEIVGTAPVFRGDLFGDADYVALGHLHLPQACGRETVRYSGSPLPMDFGETGDKHVVVAEFGPRHGNTVSIRCEPIPQTVSLVTVEGTETEVRSTMKDLVAQNKQTLVRVRLGQYEEELTSIWRDLESMTAYTPVHVLSRGRALSKEDRIAQLPDASGPDLDELSVTDLARRRLAEAGLNEADMDRLLHTLNNVL